MPISPTCHIVLTVLSVSVARPGVAQSQYETTTEKNNTSQINPEYKAIKYYIELITMLQPKSREETCFTNLFYKPISFWL